MTHSKWREAIRKSAHDALRKCVIENRWPKFDSYSNDVFALCAQVLKHKKEWVNTTDIFYIFRKHVTKLVNDKFASEEKISGQAIELFGEEALEKVANEMASFFESVPRNYIFYFPLPGMKDSFDGDIDLSENVAIKNLSNDSPIVESNRLFSLLGGMNKPSPGPHLVLKESGYAGTSLEDSASSKALGKFKQIIHLAHIRKIFKLKDVAGGYGIGVFGSHHVPNLNVFVFDAESPNIPYCSFLLPINVSRYGDRTTVDTETTSYKLAIAKEIKIAEHLKQVLLKPALLMDAKEEEAESVRTATEWAFEAQSNDNDTLAFLQVCIGLEAIFGDAISNESLTATLADRCAYFIATDIAGRKSIRNNFRELYTRRSKLVHGRRTRISDDDRFYLEWGRNALDFAIWKEIGFLKLEN